MPGERFVLRFLSPTDGCSAHEMAFEAEISSVALMVGVETADLVIGTSFYLEENDISALSTAIDLPMPDRNGEVLLAREPREVGPPYLVHTNFELPLMLDGRKPFASFADERDWLEDGLAPFKPHVDRGSLVRRERLHQHGNVIVAEIHFALPGEEWRFDAYEALTDEPGAWTSAKERRQGLLLGYTEEQCDWWMARWKGPSPPAGPSTD